MRLFSPRAPQPVPRPCPTIDAIFREDLGFVVGALLHFGIAPIDVEDAAHEVIRAVLRSLPTFDPSRDLRSWLYGVAFNVASNRLRRAGRHRALFVDELPDVADAAPTIEDQMDLHRNVREVLDGIDLDRRAVLIARVVHGMSELETAEALSIPIGTVKTRLRRAKQELRDGIKQREGEEMQEQSGAFLLPFGVLLANENRIPIVPGAMRARLWEQLQDLLAPQSAPGPANDGSPAQPSASPSLSPLRPLFRRLFNPNVARVLGGAVAGGALVFALKPRDPPPAPLPMREDLAGLCAVPLAAVPSAGHLALAVGSTLGTSGTEASALASSAPTTAPSSPRTARSSAPAEVVSTSAELADPPESAALITAATIAFERHDTATARQSLEQHAHDFPRSKLGMTRDLLWVRILLSDGKRAEARAKADALRKAAPQSLLVQALEALFQSAQPSP